MKKVLSIVTAVAFLGACSSTTVISSNPNQARLYLNGESVGTTPYVHTDTKIVGSTNVVTLKKDGYEDFTAAFSRNEEVSIGAIIGGFFVLVPFLWTMDYKPSHSYEMVPLQPQDNL
jgi:hypothetical protein